LLYLAEKTGRLLPPDLRGRVEVLQWLFWQVAAWAPWPDRTITSPAYAPSRFLTPSSATSRNEPPVRVLNKRLADREFVAGEYSVADIAAYPWVVPHEAQGQKGRGFPAPQALVPGDPRPSGHRARLQKAASVNPSVQHPDPLTEEARRVLFGQTAR